jgi:hypothetical protein
VRLLGVGVSNLVEGMTRQLSLDLATAGDDGWGRATLAVDRIRDRFGDRAVGPAALVGPDGLRPRRRGSAPWGPADAGDPGADRPSDGHPPGR